MYAPPAEMYSEIRWKKTQRGSARWEIGRLACEEAAPV
jgi:hypothetical protein